MYNKNIFIKSSLALFIGAALTSTGYAAADAEDGEKARDDNVIVITSTHREENIQDVPISVTVLDGDKINKAGIFDSTGIANNSPGLAYGEFSPGQAKFSMRGIGSADDGAGLDNSVSLFLDGIYVGRGAGINFDLFDLERIEVLKGPQGALFGRNTIGGAISVVTQKPAEEFSGKFALTAGNEGILRYQGLVTGPLSENLSGKLVVNHREHDGFVHNVVLDTDVQDEDQTSVRGQLLWRGEDSEWILSADSLKDDRADAGRTPVANRVGRGDPVGYSESLGGNRPHTTTEPIEGFTDREIKGISLHGDIEFSDWSLVTITGFRNVESSWDMPSVGVDLTYGAAPSVFGYGMDVTDDIDESIDTFSQEFRVLSDFEGSINFVAGMFFFTEETDRSEQFHLDVNPLDGPQYIRGNEYTRTQNETTSFAIYGQAKWELNEQWTAVFGGRYTSDEKDYIATAANCDYSEAELAAAGLPNFAPCDVPGSINIINESFIVPASDKWTDFSPMASVQYRPNENIMMFGTISTGFKSGGFAGSQGVASAADQPVDPENVINYELGFKSDLLDNVLRLNGTAFYMDYTDMQVVHFGPPPGCSECFGTFQTNNAGKAEISGLEVEFDWLISDNFTLSGNYAYLDTEVQDLIINGEDHSGYRLSQSPENTYNLIANYDVTAGDGNGELNINVQFTHVDEQTNTTGSEAIINKTEEKDLLSGSINWTSANELYSVSVWGRNLTGEEYIAHTYTVGPGVIGIWGAPRTYGVTATLAF